MEPEHHPMVAAPAAGSFRCDQKGRKESAVSRGGEIRTHSALDDAYITPRDAVVRNALRVFKEIFVKSGNPGHYEMMNPPLATEAVTA